MALKEFVQPEIIDINESLRLRKYDGHYELFLPGYQNPVVYQNSEGIFDESRIPNLDYVKGMCTYLAKVGELYYIEAKENGTYIPIGDVTVKDENPPIAIWVDTYRGKGIGKLVMQAMITFWYFSCNLAASPCTRLTSAWMFFSFWAKPSIDLLIFSFKATPSLWKSLQV